MRRVPALARLLGMGMVAGFARNAATSAQSQQTASRRRSGGGCGRGEVVASPRQQPQKRKAVLVNWSAHRSMMCATMKIQLWSASTCDHRKRVLDPGDHAYGGSALDGQKAVPKCSPVSGQRSEVRGWVVTGNSCFVSGGNSNKQGRGDPLHLSLTN